MPSEKEELIDAIKKTQKIMEEGEEILLVHIKDSQSNCEIATYLTKEKIGCLRFPERKSATDVYTFTKQSTSLSYLECDEFAQAVIAIGESSTVYKMIGSYLATKQRGETWPFGTHKGSDEAFEKLVGIKS